MTEVTEAAVTAALAEWRSALSDRPDPTALSQEALFRRVLEAALPHLLPQAPDLTADLEWLTDACPGLAMGRREPSPPWLKEFWLNAPDPRNGKTALFQGGTAAEAVAEARAWAEREGIAP